MCFIRGQGRYKGRDTLIIDHFSPVCVLVSGAVKEERMNEIVVCWRWEVCRDGYVTKLWAYTEGGFKRRGSGRYS